ncbi:MAG: glycosyltransferase family 4 protein [Verrucomicrobia bacterium]|nr:glycosyltransferase family 4 protein [Verrucomicrobiota bacterium]
MKILICIPFERSAPKGNSVAARRLAAGFEQKRNAVAILDYPAVADAAAVAAVVREFRPDVALVMHAWRCAAALRAIKCADVPVVASLRGTDANEMLDDPATRDELAAALSASDAIVVFHERFKERLAAMDAQWGAKTLVIANGVELPRSNMDYRQRLAIPAPAFVFATVAGLREVKRPLWPVPLLAQLRERHPAVFWVHVGPPIEADLARQMQALVAQHPWIRHVDGVPHEEMDSFLRAADVAVAASRSEGMPHAVREAMLAERALLLSDIEGHRVEAEPEREALFFGNEAEFLQQATRLIETPALRERLGDAARRRVTADLQRHDEIAAYLVLFRSLVEREGTQRTSRTGPASNEAG